MICDLTTAALITVLLTAAATLSDGQIIAGDGVGWEFLLKPDGAIEPLCPACVAKRDSDDGTEQRGC